MSDRALWLERRYPYRGAAPGARCQQWRWGRQDPDPQLHIARGWFERPCPACKAAYGEVCSTPSGRTATNAHTARLRAARWEIVRPLAAWKELARRGVTSALVPFSGQAGRGGRTDMIQLFRIKGEALVDIARRTGRDELSHALEAPVWDRVATFAGHPVIRGQVIWTAEDHSVVVVGSRGSRPFEERTEAGLRVG